MQVSLWSLVYLLIIYFGLRSKDKGSVRMPLFAGGLNFAWEGNALFMFRGWAHLVWFALDLMILALNVRALRYRRKSAAQYLLYIAAISIGLFCVFQLDYGMLISAFLIDMWIAVEYVAAARHIHPDGKTAIALTRLLGDLFAWLEYMQSSVIVLILGGIVMLCNVWYLCYCMEESSTSQKRRGRVR